MRKSLPRALIDLIPPDKRPLFRYYSVWAFAVIVSLPDLATVLAPIFGWNLDEPTAMVRVLQLVGALGAIGRFIDQKRPALPPPA